MHSFTEIPPDYGAILTIDLQQDKRTALLINAAAAILMVALLALGHFLFQPVTVLLISDPGGSFTGVLIRLAALLVGLVAYVILHELTHGAAMRHYGAKKVRFGFTGMYAFAGSERDWFDRHAYVRIALAPVVIWAVLFTIAMITSPREWFWVFYFLQIANLTGAAGDVYVTVLTLKMPEDILVMDTGVNMTFYGLERRARTGEK